MRIRKWIGALGARVRLGVRVRCWAAWARRALAGCAVRSGMFHVKHSREASGVVQGGWLWLRVRLGSWLRVWCAAQALLLAVLLAVAPCGATAFADDENNQVNPQQLPDSSFIYDTSIADLAGADAYFNNQTVQVVGEVVGDAINVTFDDVHKWITLTSPDGSNASITVFAPTAAVESIDTFGAYGKTGTTLQARGTFHLVCKEHDGLTDLHADHVSVVKKGAAHGASFNWRKFVPGIACLAVGFLLLFVFNYLRERQR